METKFRNRWVFLWGFNFMTVGNETRFFGAHYIREEKDEFSGQWVPRHWVDYD